MFFKFNKRVMEMINRIAIKVAIFSASIVWKFLRKHGKQTPKSYKKISKNGIFRPIFKD